jgi:hypothetical protein
VEFVRLLEQAQVIAVDKILASDQSLPWEEWDHLLSECLASSPLGMGQERQDKSALL